MGCAGERALETLREMDAAAVRCFRPAARKLLQELGDPEKALAMALARVTGFTAVKVGATARSMRVFPSFGLSNVLMFFRLCSTANRASAPSFLHMNGSAVACMKRSYEEAVGLRTMLLLCARMNALYVCRRGPC